MIPRVAKRDLSFKLREYEEDHDGGIINNERCQKLKTEWDISWHDFGVIMGDFGAILGSKMCVFYYVFQYFL